MINQVGEIRHYISPSNLERTHGAVPKHIEQKTLKTEIARDHLHDIDRDIYDRF